MTRLLIIMIITMLLTLSLAEYQETKEQSKIKVEQPISYGEEVGKLN